MSEVPLLDLAPKLKRPLSLWNPLDYLLLLYWVFYFPQAIRWYVETYCEPAPEVNQLAWQQRWELFRNSPYKRQLIIIGLSVAIFVLILFGVLLERVGFTVLWTALFTNKLFPFLLLGFSLGINVGYLRGLGSGLVIFVSLSVVLCVVSFLPIFIYLGIWSFIGNPVWDLELRNLVGGIVYSLVESVTNGVGLGLMMSAALGGLKNLSMHTAAKILPILLCLFALIILVSIKMSGIEILSVNSLFVFLVAFLGVSIASLRLDNRWLSIKSIPRVTPLTIPSLTRQLSLWLDLDWQRGLVNANQILKYSLQFATVDKAINNSLAASPSDNLFFRIAMISDLIENEDVLSYTSASLWSSLKSSFIEGIFWLPYKSWFAKICRADHNLHFDTQYRTVAAGFFFLRQSSQTVAKKVDSSTFLKMRYAYEEKYEKCFSDLDSAVKTLEQLRNIKHGQEVYQLACTLRDLLGAGSIESILKINAITFPDSPELRPTTWLFIKRLESVIRDVHVVGKASSRTARSYALNRCLGQISDILNDIEELPANVARIERPILYEIADIWKSVFVLFSRQLGQVEIDKPILNPYTIGDPVLGNRFIGREDILRQLEALWIVNASPQSVILYGHRRMGKTSILRNISMRLGSEIDVAYINLLSIGSAANGITDILMAICDAITEATDIPAPNNDDLLKFPETTFRRYLQHIDKTFTGKGLIIALDEFEKIEELIEAGKLDKNFLQFLRGMVQMSSKLAFAFAGLHTLQEMNADYFQPFYASFIPISVAFLTREATHQVLANPDPEFLLEYEPEALDYIYQLTNGQPYLTQLIGFQLVRLFNDYVFEQGTPRDRTFTIADVLTVCDGESFFNIGIHYFKGVWDQAAEGSTGQQDILKALAPYVQGITESALIAQTNLTSDSIQSALNTLKQHDVIRSQVTNDETQWEIAIKLFRIWVAKYKISV